MALISYMSVIIPTTDNNFVKLLLPMDCSDVLKKADWVWHSKYNDAFPKEYVNDTTNPEFFSYSFRMHAKLFESPQQLKTQTTEIIDFRKCYRQSDLFTEPFLETILKLTI